MTILTVRTDKPEAEMGLYDEHGQIGYEVWMAHRELSQTIHTKIEQLLAEHELTWQDISGIVCFQGPGSFTGLRIGLSVANALAYGLHVPIVATQNEQQDFAPPQDTAVLRNIGPAHATDRAWIVKGIHRIQAGEQDEIALPFYGASANITSPRK